MGVDAAGKETSSTWEIYAVSPHDSDIGDAGRTSARACAETTGAESEPPFAFTPYRNFTNSGESRKEYSRQCRASLSGLGACGKYSKVQFQQSFQPYLMAFFSI